MVSKNAGHNPAGQLSIDQGNTYGEQHKTNTPYSTTAHQKISCSKNSSYSTSEDSADGSGREKFTGNCEGAESEQKFDLGMCDRHAPEYPRRTVTKIVNQPEMRNILEEVKRRLIQLADNAAESVEFAVDNEIDGKVALRLLEGLGVLPSGRNVVVVEESNAADKRTPEEQHDARVKEEIRKLTEIAFARGKIYGHAMPELATPDQSATIDAQTFLTTAQVRLSDFRNARKSNKAAGVAKTAAKTALTFTARSRSLS
jgi:hypothetical protein